MIRKKLSTPAATRLDALGISRQRDPSKPAKPITRVRFSVALLMLATYLKAQGAAAQSASAIDDSQARPPVTNADLRIVKLARKILDSPSKWSRADTRICPEGAKTFSLYCALERATVEVSRNFEHRGAAMQEARFVIDEIAPNRNYNHRLMDYNNDPTTTFADIQKVFRLLERRIAQRLTAKGSKAPEPAVPPAAGQAGAPRAGRPVTRADLQVIKRAREILDSPSKWNRADMEFLCPPDAGTFSLFCALQMAEKEVRDPGSRMHGAADRGGVAGARPVLCSNLRSRL